MILVSSSQVSSNTTKQALEASLKKVMLQKPLDKITISDITSDCGISFSTTPHRACDFHRTRIHSHNYNCRQQFHRNFDLAVSQADHPEIFEGVPSEGEGIRLVKDTAKYLLKSGRPWLLVSLVCKSGWKYIGYKLGKNYKKLPRWLILKCTMNPRYWRET